LEDGTKLAEIFFKKHLGDASNTLSRWELLKFSLNQVKVDGLHLEFGVWRGTSINYLASLKPEVTFYGFDSFDGLPEDWSPFYPRGHMKIGEPPKVRANVSLITGLFRDTLNGFLDKQSESVAFLHLDADLYSSTKYALFTLADHDRLQPGTVIEFDELFYQDSRNTVLDDEHRVFLEFIDNYDVRVRWLGYFQPRRFQMRSPTLRASLMIENAD